MMNEDSNRRRGPDGPEILEMREIACSVAVALIPLLRWVHGPPVSGDQAVMRSALVVLALPVAIRHNRLVEARIGATEGSELTVSWLFSDRTREFRRKTWFSNRAWMGNLQ